MMVNGNSQGGKKTNLMREWTVRAPYHGGEDWLLSACDILTLRVCNVLGVILRYFKVSPYSFFTFAEGGQPQHYDFTSSAPDF